MNFPFPTYCLAPFLLGLCFALSTVGRDARFVSMRTAKQDISRVCMPGHCFSAPARAKSRRCKNQTIASLPRTTRFWLTEDVVDIISPEERCAFLHLATDKERDQFIEQFWSRRAPDPTALDNSFKREHYERMVFANERFPSGQIPGWKTDRGRVYVIFGPPDSTETHQSGEKTGLPRAQRLETYGFSWEAWHYKRINGVEGNVEVEFVDQSGSGDYRLALGPEENRLLFAPAFSLGRDRQKSIAEAAQAIEIHVGPAPVPLVHFKDLEAMAVSRIKRQQVQFSYRIEFASATHATTLTKIWVDVPSNQQNPSGKGTKQVTDLEIFGRISRPSGWVVDTFERRNSLTGQSSSERLQPDGQFLSALAPGKYHLAIVVKNEATGDTGTLFTAFDVPPYERASGSK